MFRQIVAPLLGGVLCLAAMPHPGAVDRTSPVLEQFEGKAISVSSPEDAGRVGIYIERWSADDELESLRQPLAQGAIGNLLPVLQKQRRRAGVLLMPGVQAHGARARVRIPKNLLFARELVTANGRRVIAASDEHLGLGEPPLEARKDTPEFNLIDIRFGPDGVGVGKVVTARDVTYNQATKSLEIKDYARQPSRLVDVRSETR